MLEDLKATNFKKYFILYIVTFCFFSIFKVVKVNLTIEYICEIIFMIPAIYFICRIENPFSLEKIKQYSRIEKPVFPKLLVIIILTSIVVAKFAITIKARYITKTLEPFSINQVLLFVVTFLVGGFFEELLFKWGFYQEITKTRISSFLSILIISLLFFLLHGQFGIYKFIATIVFQVFSLVAYKYYPNILLFCFFHALINISFFI